MSEFAYVSDPYHQLLRHWPLPESGFPVAYRAGAPIGRETFESDIAQAARTLSRLALSQNRFVLFETEVYAFAVWLLAGWSQGCQIILPGDDLPATRARLDLPWVGSGAGNVVETWEGFCSSPDKGRPGGVCGGEASNNPGKGQIEPPQTPLNPPLTGGKGNLPAVLLFTSGSSGQPCLIEKTLTQLRREIETLQRAFGAHLPPGCRFVSSVPHQHMYGLPFALLWPLTFSHPIVTERLRYPEDLWRLPPADYALIGAPTFLKHLPLPTEAGFALEAGLRWRLATSAGSPLFAEVGTRVAALLNAPMVEIYGSTETGAVAWRRERRVHDANPPWQPLPDVRLAIESGEISNGQLRIFSSFLAPDEIDGGFLSKDLASLDAEGQLTLLGRADRIVKIGEKRISINQVEQALKALPEIGEAVVLSLSGAGGREILGAVVILTETGKIRQAALDEAQFAIAFPRFLRAALRDQLDPLALPRRWRVVEALPKNDMGKTLLADLQHLFVARLPHVQSLAQNAAAGGTTDIHPTVHPAPVEGCASTSSARTEKAVEKVVLQLTLPPDLIWFEGHFPDLPDLPGVAQIDWAAHFGRLHFGFNAPVTGVTGLKFQHIIRPADTPRLTLLWREEKQELEFAYHLNDMPCSRGVLGLKKKA
jgi:3-hydroxymyristoyl/3-hydroxydecanoyl-(acyl carrier protein) dehydratase